jgi:putative ABC transport system substrate-binding protein
MGSGHGYRVVLTVAAFACLARPGAAQDVRVPKLGILAISRADSIDALVNKLAEIGWVDGRTMQVVFPEPARDDAGLAQHMRELIAAKVDLVVAQTKPAVMVARAATASVPIVMGAFNGDPVKDGLVRSIERPGTNVTGTFYYRASGGGERVAVLTGVAPQVKRVGILLNPDSAASLALAQELIVAAEAAGLTVSRMETRGPDDIDRVFASAAANGVQGVVTVTGAEMFAVRPQVVSAQDRHGLPTVMGSIGYPELGGLAKLGPNVPGLWEKMAQAHIDRLFKGAKSGDLPLIALDDFELVVNLQAAQRLGLSVPDAIRRRATKLVD